MKDEDIKVIVDLSIDKAKDAIAALDADGVDAVRAAEVAGQNREGFIALLDARDKDIATAAEKAAAKPAKPDAKAAPAWQSPDYSGPLTAGQGEWRQRNIKPAKAKTK